MIIKAKSTRAIEADILAKGLQLYFVNKLNIISERFGSSKKFEEVKWTRDAGKNGRLKSIYKK